MPRRGAALRARRVSAAARSMFCELRLAARRRPFTMMISIGEEKCSVLRRYVGGDGPGAREAGLAAPLCRAPGGARPNAPGAAPAYDDDDPAAVS